MSATRESVRNRCNEVALDEVGGRSQVGTAARCARSFAAMAALQPRHAQQPGDPLARAAHALIAQFSVDTRCAICATALRVNRANLVGEGEIALGARRCRSLSPRVVAAAGDAKHAAQQGDRMIRLLHLDECEHR